MRSCEYRVVGTAFGGGPYGATTLARGAPKWGGAAMANTATRAFDGAPYGAAILVRGVPKWAGGRMRTQPPGPSLELPMGPRSS